MDELDRIIASVPDPFEKLLDNDYQFQQQLDQEEQQWSELQEKDNA